MKADRSSANLRRELAQALGLGELLVLAALVALAPAMRLEDAYVPAIKFRPYDVVGEGFFLWMVAILGLLVAARIAAAGRLRLPEPATVALLAGWTIFVALRGLTSDHPFEARNQATMWFGHLALFAILLAALGRGDGGTTRRVLVAAMIAGLALESLRTGWQALVTLPRLHEEVRSGQPLAGLHMDSPVAVSRVFSSDPMNSFLSPNLLAAWLAMAALAGAGYMAGCLAGAIRPGPGVERSPARLAGLIASALPLAALVACALALTGSKGAWLAAFAGAIGWLVASPPPAGSERARHRLRLAGGAILALALAAAFAYWLRPELPGGAGLTASAKVRLGYWRAAATMVAENPALGVGPGTFGAHFPALKGPLAEESQSTHCAWIETAAEYGFLGLALLAGFWGLVLWRLWRQPLPTPDADHQEEPGKAAAMVLMAGMGAMLTFGWLKFGQETLVLFALPLIWAAAFALAAWPLVLGKKGGAGGAETPAVAYRWLSWGLAAALVAFLLHASVDMDMGMKSLVGTALALAALALSAPGGRELSLEGRRALLGAALIAALSAVTFWCGLREYRRGGAMAALEEPPPASLAKRPFERAEWIGERLGAAVAVDPLNYHLHMALANVCRMAQKAAPDPESADRYRSRAEAELRLAVELAPGRTTPRRALGQWLLLDGRPEEAARVFEAAHALYPLKAEILLEQGDAELLAGRADEARGLYRAAIETSRRVADEAIHLSVLFETPGNMKWETPRLDELAAALDRAIADRPGDGALLLRRALVEVARGRAAEALEWLGRATRAEPRDAQLALFEGYGLRLAGQPEKALEKMREAGKLEGSPGALSAGPRAVAAAIARTGDAMRRESGR